MSADPIDRREPHGNDLLKRDDVLLAVHGAIKEVLGVTAIRARVGYAVENALDKLPALDADGRWEKAMQRAKEKFTFLAKAAHSDAERASYEDAASLMDDYMDEAREAPAPPAAERMPAVEHVCDYRCKGESGHHAWPSPTSGDAAKREGN